jgi:hypothetical protein
MAKRQGGRGRELPVLREVAGQQHVFEPHRLVGLQRAGDLNCGREGSNGCELHQNVDVRAELVAQARRTGQAFFDLRAGDVLPLRAVRHAVERPDLDGADTPCSITSP